MSHPGRHDGIATRDREPRQHVGQRPRPCSRIRQDRLDLRQASLAGHLAAGSLQPPSPPTAAAGDAPSQRRHPGRRTCHRRSSASDTPGRAPASRRSEPVRPGAGLERRRASAERLAPDRYDCRASADRPGSALPGGGRGCAGTRADSTAACPPAADAIGAGLGRPLPSTSRRSRSGCARPERPHRRPADRASRGPPADGHRGNGRTLRCRLGWLRSDGFDRRRARPRGRLKDSAAQNRWDRWMVHHRARHRRLDCSPERHRVPALTIPVPIPS